MVLWQILILLKCRWQIVGWGIKGEVVKVFLPGKHKQKPTQRFPKPLWFLLRGGRGLYELVGNGWWGSSRLLGEKSACPLPHTETPQLHPVPPGWSNGARHCSEGKIPTCWERNQRVCRRGEGWGEKQTDQHLASSLIKYLLCDQSAETEMKSLVSLPLLLLQFHLLLQ